MISIATVSCGDLCPPLPGAEPFLKSGQVVLVGEVHGTQEGPEMVGQIACNALQSNLRVTIGLEIPQEDQDELDIYLDSNGSEEAKQKFLALNFWSRDYQDGRASQSIFQLIESVRILRENKKHVDIVSLDREGVPNRDKIMAERLLEDVESYPNNFFIVLTGNLHNIISDGSGRMGSYVVDAIGSNRVVSLKQTYPGGSAWVCLDEGGCGPVTLRGNDVSGFGIQLDESMDNYNGILGLDSIHASLPAKQLIGKI